LITLGVSCDSWVGVFPAKAQHKCNNEVAAFNCCESFEEAPTSWDQIGAVRAVNLRCHIYIFDL